MGRVEHEKELKQEAREMIHELSKENEQLRNCLENLVQLKEWKDKYGKDEHYLINQPRAWDRAKEILNPSEVK
jgi:hypothetical protein